MTIYDHASISSGLLTATTLAMGALTTQKAEADPTGKNIVGYYVRFHTEDDDKDSGETVSGEVQRPSNGQVLADKDEFGKKEHRWKDQTDQPDSNDASWGRKGWFALDTHSPYLKAGEGAYLYIRKTGNNGWNFRVDLMVMVEGESDVEYITYRSSRVRLDDKNREVKFPV